MNKNDRSKNSRFAICHVDMDGLETIYKANGLPLGNGSHGKAFFSSAVRNALEFFNRCRIKATFFVVADDLRVPDRIRCIRSIVQQGHSLGAHGKTHRNLIRSTDQEKKKAIEGSKQMIEDAVGQVVRGFRAPGYCMDHSVISHVAEAGYEFDSSIFPTSLFRERLKKNEIPYEPFRIIKNTNLIEFPLPYVGFGLPPFHPCYAFVLSRFYHHVCLAIYEKKATFITYLFHLTDFADYVAFPQGIKMKIMTNNMFDWKRKRCLLTKLVKRVQERYTVITTELALKMNL